MKDFTGKLTLKIVKVPNKIGRYEYSVIKQNEDLEGCSARLYISGETGDYIYMASCANPAIVIGFRPRYSTIWLRGDEYADNDDKIIFNCAPDYMRIILNTLRKYGVKVLTGKKDILVNGVKYEG
jgi:hypothetical protein